SELRTRSLFSKRDGDDPAAGLPDIAVHGAPDQSPRQTARPGIFVVDDPPCLSRRGEQRARLIQHPADPRTPGAKYPIRFQRKEWRSGTAGARELVLVQRCRDG